MSEASELPQQVFSVLGGNPTQEELAVVVAVLQAASATAAANDRAATAPVSSWTRNSALLRTPITPGAGQWRAAYIRGLSR